MDQERWQTLKEIFWTAAECDTGARADYIANACAGDAAMRAEVESLLEAHAVDDGFIEQPAAEFSLGSSMSAKRGSWIGRRLSSYRIVEEIGRGGMSDVYKAVRDDDEYQKEVAVKVLRSGYANTSLLDRFKIEKQILATLDHPNIAKLLDGGRTQEGLPYLVMDYICGQPIDEYCTHNDLSINQRLELFRTLCTAVQYVHQHLMVHGDLKCSNVLVAAGGVVKLLDFGIAKLLNPNPGVRSHDGRLTTVLALTPEYASPEQIRGGPITTASDVYSLGIVLFRLLTGVLPRTAPHNFSYELACQICDQDPPLASVAAGENELLRRAGVPSKLSGDIDNIVLMAMQKDPVKRYSSVEQLSEDVRRYLQGFPVAARAPSVPYKVGKFLRRHMAGLAAVSLLILTLIGGIVATSWEAHIAGIERARAERHFADVRKLANTFMFDVEGAIETLPGATAARQMLVTNSLAYLDGLSAESTYNPGLQRELATAYEKIADIQGGFRQANLGDAPHAVESYRKAAGIRSALIAHDPSAQDVRRELLRNYGKLSELLSGIGDQPAAIQISRRLRDQAQTLAAAPNSTTADRRNLGNADGSLGWLLARSGQVDRGLLLINGSIEIYQTLLETDSHDLPTRRNLALAYGRAGEILLSSTQRFPEAARMYEKDYEVIRPMADEDRGNADLRKIEGFALIGRGDALGKIGDLHTALEQHLGAVSTLRPLFTADPRNDEARFDLGYALGQTSESLFALGDLPAAQGHLQEAIEILSQSAGAHAPALGRAQVSLGIDYFRLGQISTSRALDPKSSGVDKIRSCQTARQWFERSASILSAADQDAQWRSATEGRAGMIAGELQRCKAGR
jgi:tetratricopeptide (TPR) repeat protein